MKKLGVIIAVLAVLAVTVLPVTAQMRMRGDYGHGAYHVPDVTTIPDLNLTEEQVADLNILRQKHLRDINPLQDQMIRKSEEIKFLWLKKSPDQNKILAAQNEMQNLRNRVLKAGENYRLEIINVLTPEQRGKLKKHRMERYGYGGKRFRNPHEY